VLYPYVFYKKDSVDNTSCTVIACNFSSSDWNRQTIHEILHPDKAYWVYIAKISDKDTCCTDTESDSESESCECNDESKKSYTNTQLASNNGSDSTSEQSTINSNTNNINSVETNYNTVTQTNSYNEINENIIDSVETNSVGYQSTNYNTENDTTNNAENSNYALNPTIINDTNDDLLTLPPFKVKVKKDQDDNGKNKFIINNNKDIN
jgi:hypothetical protein